MAEPVARLIAYVLMVDTAELGLFDLKPSKFRSTIICVEQILVHDHMSGSTDGLPLLVDKADESIALQEAHLFK
jgi:hypothetical protein